MTAVAPIANPATPAIPALIDTSSAPSNASPLWIIALFIALSEAVASIAAIETDGTTRLMFASFAVSFPFLVFLFFWWMLVRHPANLYPPSQYSSQTTTISDYAKTLRREQDAGFDAIKAGLAAAVTETIASTGTAAARKPARVSAVRNEAEKAFEEAIGAAMVTVDPSRIAPFVAPFSVPVTASTTVDQLLDSIYFSIQSAVKPYTYNASWVLAPTTTLTPITDIGTRWAMANGMTHDERPLTEAGLSTTTDYVVLPTKG